MTLLSKEHEETKQTLEKQREELNEVKKESHKRKKMLIAQQQMLTAGTNSYHKVSQFIVCVLKIAEIAEHFFKEMVKLFHIVKRQSL